MPGTNYAFDNASDHAAEHHSALAELLDPITQRRIVELFDPWGRKCLEVGAGGGTIARWLASEAGPDGSVLAVDLNPRPIEPFANLRVMQHDITSGNAFGQDYDLIHARLLLNHLPTRREVLHQLATRLAPGGVLITSDFWPTSPVDLVVTAPSMRDSALLARFQQKYTSVLKDHKVSPSWARDAALTFMNEDLDQVEVVFDGSYWRGGGAGCRLLAAGLKQLSGELVGVGFSEEEQLHARALLKDPNVLLRGHALYTTSGKRL